MRYLTRATEVMEENKQKTKSHIVAIYQTLDEKITGSRFPLFSIHTTPPLQIAADARVNKHGDLESCRKKSLRKECRIGF